MLLNCGAGDFWELFGLQGDQTSQSKRKSTLNIHWKDWCWNSNSLATWYEGPTHWKSLWYWERLKAEGEGDNRGWDGLIASLIQFNGHEFEETLGDSGRQRRLVCCSPWGCRLGRDWATEQHNHKHTQTFLRVRVTDSGRRLCAERGETKVVSSDALPVL